MQLKPIEVNIRNKSGKTLEMIKELSLYQFGKWYNKYKGSV